MVVTCVECGAEFDAIRSSATLCSARCRQRVSRRARKAGAQGNVVPIGALPRKSAGSKPAVSAEVGQPLSIESRTLRELGDASDTALGQACLLIARRLDDRVDASGAAVSSLVGRLERLMESIAAAHAVEQVEADESNPITFLQQRAAERIARAGAG